MADPLLTPIFDTSNPTVHFFEGRLLTARDLREQQTANRNRRDMLGRAIGSGIIEGLEVSLVVNGSADTSPVVQVAAGVALNPLGQLLHLSGDQNLTLSDVGAAGNDDAGLFRTCDPATSTATYTDFGVYVLVMSPASGYSEYAPKIELGDEGVAKGCGRRYALEGVQFRLVGLPLQNYPDISAAQAILESATTNTTQVQALSRLRSIVAHAFLSSAATARHQAQLRDDGAAVFAPPTAALDLLGELTLLSECDVPLAVLFWDTVGVRYVDNWAARRLARWGANPDDSSLFPVSGLERLLQFQTQVTELLGDIAVPTAAEAEDHFRYLPPAGYFPVQGSGSNTGFSASGFMNAFFDQVAASLTAGQFTRLLSESFAFESIDLDTQPYIQLFSLRQNTEDVASGSAFQLVHGFATRELNGPAIDDGVTHVLEDAWDAYRTLIRRRDFISFSDSSSAHEACFAIEASIRDVMDVANRVAAQAAAGGLDVAGALVVFDALYDVQSELIDIFETGIPDFGNQLDRDTFTAGLKLRVAGDSSVGEPGLNGALDSRVLHYIVLAQQTINDYVRAWQAGGPFFFTILDAPSGFNLVPGKTAEWRFMFTNGRSETLRFRLLGEVGAKTGSWDSATVTLRNDFNNDDTPFRKFKALLEKLEKGRDLTNVNLKAGQSILVSARFKTPFNARIGQSATLTLSAEILSTLERNEFSVEIPIARKTGDLVPGRRLVK